MYSTVLSKRVVDARQKNRRCSAKESSVLSKRIDGAQQKSRRCSAKESTVLGKRVVDARQKNRRCSAKESTMLRASIQYTLRYHLIAMRWQTVKLKKDTFLHAVNCPHSVISIMMRTACVFTVLRKEQWRVPCKW